MIRILSNRFNIFFYDNVYKTHLQIRDLLPEEFNHNLHLILLCCISVFFFRLYNCSLTQLASIKLLKGVTSHLEYISKQAHGILPLYSIELLRYIIQHLDHSFSCQM